MKAKRTATVESRSMRAKRSSSAAPLQSSSCKRQHHCTVSSPPAATLSAPPQNSNGQPLLRAAETRNDTTEKKDSRTTVVVSCNLEQATTSDGATGTTQKSATTDTASDDVVEATSKRRRHIGHRSATKMASPMDSLIASPSCNTTGGNSSCDPAESVSSSSSLLRWACSQCTLVNDAHKRRCGACGERRAIIVPCVRSCIEARAAPMVDAAATALVVVAAATSDNDDTTLPPDKSSQPVTHSEEAFLDGVTATLSHPNNAVPITAPEQQQHGTAANHNHTPSPTTLIRIQRHHHHHTSTADDASAPGTMLPTSSSSGCCTDLSYAIDTQWPTNCNTANANAAALVQDSVSVPSKVRPTTGNTGTTWTNRDQMEPLNVRNTAEPSASSRIGRYHHPIRLRSAADRTETLLSRTVEPWTALRERVRQQNVILQNQQSALLQLQRQTAQLMDDNQALVDWFFLQAAAQQAPLLSNVNVSYVPLPPLPLVLALDSQSQCLPGTSFHPPVAVSEVGRAGHAGLYTSTSGPVDGTKDDECPANEQRACDNSIASPAKMSVMRTPPQSNQTATTAPPSSSSSSQALDFVNQKIWAIVNTESPSDTVHADEGVASTSHSPNDGPSSNAAHGLATNAAYGDCNQEQEASSLVEKEGNAGTFASPALSVDEVPNRGTTVNPPSPAHSTQTFDPDEAPAKIQDREIANRLFDQSCDNKLATSATTTTTQCQKIDTSRNDVPKLPLDSCTNRQRGKPSSKPAHGWISNRPARQFIRQMQQHPPRSLAPDARPRESNVPEKSNPVGPITPSHSRADPLWNESQNDAEQQPSYRYKETVRCQKDRQGLACHDCPQCRKFYAALRKTGHDVAEFNDTSNDTAVQQFGRHKARFVDTETPVDFWELDFIDERPASTDYQN
jgi:hypothetical protein